MDLTGYKQLVRFTMDQYNKNESEAMQIVDKALLRDSVITLMLEVINENMSEEE